MSCQTSLCPKCRALVCEWDECEDVSHETGHRYADQVWCSEHADHGELIEARGLRVEVLRLRHDVLALATLVEALLPGGFQGRQLWGAEDRLQEIVSRRWELPEEPS